MTAKQSRIKEKSNTDITTERRACQFERLVASDPIQMEIVFGRPSKDCVDIGICRINLVSDMPSSSKELCDCENIAIALVQQQRNGQLLFRFPKNQLNKTIIKTQFADNLFTVAEPYILPELLQRLYSPRLLIEVGSYRVTEEPDYFVLEI